MFALIAWFPLLTDKKSFSVFLIDYNMDSLVISIQEKHEIGGECESFQGGECLSLNIRLSVFRKHMKYKKACS